jgi:hypothetical protein
MRFALIHCLAQHRLQPKRIGCLLLEFRHHHGLFLAEYLDQKD